jgi:hypothetical protein
LPTPTASPASASSPNRIRDVDGALDRGQSGATGKVEPGIIRAGQDIQLTMEAVIPVNRASGNSVGVLAQLHFFLLFAQTIGRPLIR